MKIIRKFSMIGYEIKFPDAIQYTRPWKYKILDNGIRLNYDDHSYPGCCLSILSEIGSGIDDTIYNTLDTLKNNLKYPGLSFRASSNETIINIACLNDSASYFIKDFIYQVNNFQEKKAIPSTEDKNILDILYKSCYSKNNPQKTNEDSIKSLFSINNFIISSIGFSDTILSEFSNLIPHRIQIPELSEYKPYILVSENKSEEVLLCIAYKAPPISHPDSFLFRFLETMMTTNKPILKNYTNYNEQYNYLYSLLNNVPGIFNHTVAYKANKTSGLFIHTIECHSLSVSFAGSAIIKSMARTSKELLPQEIQRTQKDIYTNILKYNYMQTCEQYNQDLRANRQPKDYIEFVLNAKEDYICNKLHNWISASEPSIAIKGEILSENVIESMFTGC
jgi:Peptidase M16 inactive domain